MSAQSSHSSPRITLYGLLLIAGAMTSACDTEPPTPVSPGANPDPTPDMRDEVLRARVGANPDDPAHSPLCGQLSCSPWPGEDPALLRPGSCRETHLSLGADGTRTIINVVERESSGQGRVTEVRDDFGATRQTYDGRRMTRAEDIPLGQNRPTRASTFTYGPQGRLATLLEELNTGQTTEHAYKYDMLGRITLRETTRRVLSPSSVTRQTSLYVYTGELRQEVWRDEDLSGNLSEPDTLLITRTWSEAGQLTQVREEEQGTEPLTLTRYAYDASGRLSSASVARSEEAAASLPRFELSYDDETSLVSAITVRPDGAWLATLTRDDMERPTRALIQLLDATRAEFEIELEGAGCERGALNWVTSLEGLLLRAP